MRAENINMIEKEIDILLKLDHPNIIKLLDYKRTVNNFYLIFEFCEHGDLDNYIRNNSDNKKLPEAEVKRIVK
jgi:serine/threonine-protein kinase ULK/ATG1